jgi:hypothetical protein
MEMGLPWEQELRDVARKDFGQPDDDAIGLQPGTDLAVVGLPIQVMAPKRVGERMRSVENRNKRIELASRAIRGMLKPQPLTIVSNP